MQIGKMVAAHHQFVHGTARLHHTQGMVQTPLVALNFMRETTLQGVPRVVDPLLGVAYAVKQLAPQCARATIDLTLEIYDIRHNQFGRSARGRCAQVCHKIANGKIDFVTDSRDDWHGAMEYRARDDLFVELPQIFDAAATARYHDEIDRMKRLVRRGELADPHGNLLRCAGSLHAHRVDQNLQPRRATTEHVQNVADGCATW